MTPPDEAAHLCWVYDRAEDLRDRLRRFLLDGLAAGERICLVIDESGPAVLDEPEFAVARERGAALLLPVSALYQESGFVPEAQVRACAGMLAAALADGYPGMRIAADVTSLAETAEQAEAFARYEFLITRFLIGKPLTGLCLFDRNRVSESALRHLICMHPPDGEPGPMFRICATPDGAALVGEYDMHQWELLPLALERAEVPPVDGRVVLDATGLTFMDHHGVLALAEYARGHRATVVLRTPTQLVERLRELLDVEGVRVEAPC